MKGADGHAETLLLLVHLSMITNSGMTTLPPETAAVPIHRDLTTIAMGGVRLLIRTNMTHVRTMMIVLSGMTHPLLDLRLNITQPSMKGPVHLRAIDLIPRPTNTATTGEERDRFLLHPMSTMMNDVDRLPFPLLR